MDLSLISDTLSTIATKYNHGFGFSNSITDHQIPQIHALMVPIDAIAPPTIKPRTAPKKLARKRCRIKRSSKSDGGDAFVNEDSGGFFDGGDGPFGGGGGGGGGDGGFGGFNWEESVPESRSDPAFDFVYGVISWIVLVNCLHFSVKKVIRMVSDHERQKVQFRFTVIC